MTPFHIAIERMQKRGAIGFNTFRDDTHTSKKHGTWITWTHANMYARLGLNRMAKRAERKTR